MLMGWAERFSSVDGLPRRNRDNKSNSKDNRIGAKFPYMQRLGVDAVKF